MNVRGCIESVVLGAVRRAITAAIESAQENIPWEEIRAINDELGQLSGELAAEAGALRGEIETLTRNYRDSQEKAMREVCSWCILATSLLEAYQSVLGQNKSERVLLVQILKNGAEKMTDARLALEDCTLSLNKILGNLTKIKATIVVEMKSRQDNYANKVSLTRTNVYSTAAMAATLTPIVGAAALVATAAIVEFHVIPEMAHNFEVLERNFNEFCTIIATESNEIMKAKVGLSSEINTIQRLEISILKTQNVIPLENQISAQLSAAISDLINLCLDYQERHKQLLSSERSA